MIDSDVMEFNIISYVVKFFEDRMWWYVDPIETLEEAIKIAEAHNSPVKIIKKITSSEIVWEK